MSLDWLYRLANWNPQFFREIKGRLKPRNLAVTVLASLGMQALLIAYFCMALPGNQTDYNYYCTGETSYALSRCLQDASGNVIINWTLWWGQIYQVLSLTLPFIVLIAGVYMLISDLSKETRRGTLNFIRLSPQHSQDVLLGKLLGVPIVPFLAVALAVPLHLVSAMGSNASFKMVTSGYLVTIAVSICYLVGAMLFAFWEWAQGWMGAALVWGTFSISSQRLDYPSAYFGIRIDKHLSLLVAFALITLGVATYWLWQAVNRRFQNPNATLLSKRQSYLLTACFEFWLLGFVFRDRADWENIINDLAAISFINLFWFVILIAALMPQRQMLLDWARYRRERVSSSKRFWNHSVIKELVWGEKSPAVLAIAINLLIAMALFTPWVLTWTETEEKFQALATMLLGGMFVMLCAAIVQLMMFMKTPKRTLWAAGTVSILIFAPPVLLTFASVSPTTIPIAWLFSAFFFMALGSASAVDVLVSFLTYLGIFSLLTTRLTHQLRKAGESELKALAPAKGEG